MKKGEKYNYDGASAPQPKKDAPVVDVKAKLDSAKDELKKRYGETVEKIREDIKAEESTGRDPWDDAQANF